MATGILALQGSFNDHCKSLELVNKEYLNPKNSLNLFSNIFDLSPDVNQKSRAESIKESIRGD